MSFQVVGLEFDRKDIQMNKLVATCLEGKFHTFDMRTQHPEKGFAYVTEKVAIKPDHFWVVNFTCMIEIFQC